MKTLKIFFLVFLIGKAFSQNQIQYKMVADEPRKINNFSCNIDIAQMDFGLGNIDGGSFNTGVWGSAMYQQKMGVDYTFRYGWLTLGKFAFSNAKHHLNFQAGAFYILNQNTKLGMNKVILKQTNGTSGGKSVTVTEFLMIPSSKWKYRAVRAGLYFNRSCLRIKNDFGPDVAANYYIFGAYGGICFGSSRRVIIQTDKYGEKGVVSHLRFCLDALITPINNIPAGVKNAIPIGGRLLVQALPVLRKKDKRGKYKSAITVEVEAGYRMVDGVYVAGTFAIPISRSIKALRGTEEDQTVKRTAE